MPAHPPRHHTLVLNSDFNVAGQKKWKIYPKDHTKFLYFNRFDGSFAVDGFESESELKLLRTKLPLLNHSKPWEFVQQPGELVMVPVNCAHQVTKD